MSVGSVLSCRLCFIIWGIRKPVNQECDTALQIWDMLSGCRNLTGNIQNCDIVLSAAIARGRRPLCCTYAKSIDKCKDGTHYPKINRAFHVVQ